MGTPKKKFKIGLITYHSAYNFGSVFQTYATIKFISDLGYEIETIDYRTPSQTRWYNTDVVKNKGFKNYLKTRGFYSVKKDRAIRRKKFEDFIVSYLKPTQKRYTTYDQIRQEHFDYDILLAGSDQIWNFGCGEFSNEKFDAIRPYFLEFGNPIKRISFASSIGTQSFHYVKRIKDHLSNIDNISIREPIAARYINKLHQKEITQICDPTWLLTKEDWAAFPGVYKPRQRKYIFIYTLAIWSKTIKRWANILIKYAEENNLDIICVSPLTYIKHPKIETIHSAGPIDILSLLLNAELVITNTFHGTMFSINLEVPFFVIGATIGSRQQQMLELCDLESRIVFSPSELSDSINDPCDFTYSSSILKNNRIKAQEFLKTSLDT